MDRFIESLLHQQKVEVSYLKSNMDRFIATYRLQIRNIQSYLKSNMDRFIGAVKTFIFTVFVI